jgi:hypothetical protein
MKRSKVSKKIGVEYEELKSFLIQGSSRTVGSL